MEHGSAHTVPNQNWGAIVDRRRCCCQDNVLRDFLPDCGTLGASRKEHQCVAEELCEEPCCDFSGSLCRKGMEVEFWKARQPTSAKWADLRSHSDFGAELVSELCARPYTAEPAGCAPGFRIGNGRHPVVLDRAPILVA